MTSITHIREMYKKKGQAFLDDLFNVRIVATEKLDGARFEFERIGKNLVFYKRDGVEPINIIDRTLMVFFEKPIKYFESLSQSVIMDLPPNYRFGFEYFVNKNGPNITYDRLPQNTLVLTDVRYKNEFGDLEYFDTSKVYIWSLFFGLEKPPILFDHKLDEVQKQKILSFLNMTDNELLLKFKTESFTKYIYDIFNPYLKTSFMMNDLDKMIEGVILNIYGEQTYMVKMVCPSFTEHAKNKSLSKMQPTDTTEITINFLNKFTTFALAFDMYSMEVTESDYLSLISRTFNSFIQKYRKDFENSKFETFNDQPEFRINTTFICNEKTISLINESDVFHDMFKIVLSTYSKERKRPTRTITKEMMPEINKVYRKYN